MKNYLNEYAELIINHGLNLQKGEILHINSPVNAAPLVEEVAKVAYQKGAKKIINHWSDGKISALKYEYESVEDLEDVPDYVAEARNCIVEQKGVYLGILSEDPAGFAGLDSQKIARARRAMNKALRPMREATSSNRVRWCLVAYPQTEWAEKMFPDLSKDKAYEKQWEYILKTMRLDAEDPLKAWEEHQEKLTKRCDILNNANIRYFRYKNSLGTDFKIGMPKGYIFCGGAEKGLNDGVYFTANMPTEEVFSSPDRLTAEGKLVSAMPLCRNGAIIENFSITFKGGRIVDYSAEKGYDVLKGIIDTDEGSHYLGEIALIGKNSPIHKLGVLFYETLFDENASCHFAIGDSYVGCLKGGENMDEETLHKHGLNTSLEHVDFMVGTDDLSIEAECEDGTIMQIFADGDWVI